MKITAEQLHTWYLEAVRNLRPESFNPNAVRPFAELTDEQRAIDGYIAKKINDAIEKMCWKGDEPAGSE